MLSKVRTWAGRVGEIRVGEGADPIDLDPGLRRRHRGDPGEGHGSTTTPATASARSASCCSSRWASPTTTRCSWRTRSSGAAAGGGATCSTPTSASCPTSRSGRRARTGRWSSTGRSTTPATRRSRTTPGSTASWPGTTRPGRSSGCRRSSRSKTQAELGKLVILDHLLRGDNLDQYAEHLSLQDRLSARLILENQQSALAGTLRLALNAAYGIAREPQPGMLDAAHEAAEGHFRSLEPGFTPQVPVGADLKRGARTPARPGPGVPVPRPPALRARGQEVGLREGARRGAEGRAGRGRPRARSTSRCGR